MEINDTLKFKAYGWKKDYDQKKDVIDRHYREHRQYYPPDAHGVLDEWQALIKNQSEIFKQDERLRKEKEYQMKEQYKNDLDKQMKERKFLTDIEQAKKKNEQDLLQNQASFSFQLGQQIKLQEDAQRQQLNDTYHNQMEDNKRKAVENKNMNLIEDKNMIDMDRFKGRDSQRALKDRNLLYKQDLDNVADYHNYLKNVLAPQQKQKEDEQYMLGLQRENEKRDKEKEDWFNKYKNIAAEMDKRVNSTLAQAKPTLDRQRELNDKINDNVDKYGTKLFDDKEREMDEMKAKWRNAYNENQRQLQLKTNATKESKLKDKMDMEYKQRETMAYNQEEEKRKREIEDQRNLYKETLQNQMTLNALNKYNYGKMTMQEKYLNKNDLKSYKNKERNTIHALIPGIKNIDSVGSKPLLRGALNMMDFSDSPPEGPKGRKGQMFFSPEPRQIDGFGGKETFQHPLPHQSGVVRNPSEVRFKPGTPTGSIFSNKPISRTEFERYKQNAGGSNIGGFNTSRNAYSVASIYDPIVNPVDKSYKVQSRY